MHKFAVTTLGRSGVIILNIIVLRETIAQLSASNLSLYYLILIYASLGQLFFITPAGSYFNNIILKNKDTVREIVLKVTLSYACVCALIAPVFAILIHKEQFLDLKIVSCIFIAMLIPVNNLYLGLWTIVNFDKYIIFSLLPLIPSSLTLLLVKALILNDYSDWFVYNLVSNVILFFTLCMLTSNSSNVKSYKFEKFDIFKFSIFLLPTLIITWYINNYFKLKISLSNDVTYFAEFLIGFGIASSIIGAIETVYLQISYPKFMNDSHSRSTEVELIFLKHILHYFLLLTVSCLILYKLVDNITLIIINKSTAYITEGFKFGVLFESLKSIYSQNSIYFQRKNSNLLFTCFNVLLFVIFYITYNYYAELYMALALYTYTLFSVMILLMILLRSMVMKYKMNFKQKKEL